MLPPMAPPVAAEPTPPSFPPAPPPMLVPTPKRGGVPAAPTNILSRPRRPAAAAAPPLRGISSAKKLLTPHQDAEEAEAEAEVAAAVDSAAAGWTPRLQQQWGDMGAYSDSPADDADKGADAFREAAAEDAKDMLYRLTTPLD
eukprot:1854544-Pyramimonas_sp.AAC.1